MPVFFKMEDDNDGVIMLFETDFLGQQQMKFHEYTTNFPLKQAVKTSFTRPKSTKHVKKARKVQVF